MTDKDVLPENDMLEKATALKRFDYSQLGEAFENRQILLKNRQRLLIRKNTK